MDRRMLLVKKKGLSPQKPQTARRGRLAHPRRKLNSKIEEPEAKAKCRELTDKCVDVLKKTLET